ncbi:ABC transporter permease [Anaerolineales bacterium HSG25]|nr:ABC transporter permease [Anaerolineales bacterium HSG25]
MELHAIIAIAYRDVLKFLRDRIRIVSTLVFPAVFIIILGNSFSGLNTGYDFMVYVFTGVYAQNLFQSTSLGIISLIEDRENDFSQEIFVSPISRYSIIFGKIAGETAISMLQGLAIILLGLLISVPMSVSQFLGLMQAGLIVCLFGGSFGVVVLANLKSQRAANQIFPFIILPQFFLAGIFNPISDLPPYLEVLSRISPMRYAVDLTRAIYYNGQPEYPLVVQDSLWVNMGIIVILFFIFLIAGTMIFVRSEKNR